MVVESSRDGVERPDYTEATVHAGLQFIRPADGVEQARERLVGLEELIETARSVK
jgi:hypothetical protein